MIVARDVSIAFKASDNLTNSIQSMRRSVGGLSRDVSEYRRIQAQAFDKRTEIKFDITKAKSELKELEKALKKNAEGSEEAFKEKQRALEDLQEEYKRLTRVAQEASKAEARLQDDINKTNNRNLARLQQDINTTNNSNLTRMQEAANGTSLLSTLATSGLINMVGTALQSSLNQTISSTYGETTGSAISNVVGGIVSGTAMGSLAGPIGAAVGAAVGGLTGAINSLTEQQQKKDDYFKDEVQGLYSQVKEEQDTNLQSGITMAGEREQLVMALGTLLGSQEAGDKMFDEIKQFGIDTPYEGTGMVNAAKQMLAYGIKAENVMGDMKMLGEVAMGDQNKFNSLTYAYAQTQSAGKLTGQDLLQYTAAGFNPLSVLAEERGKTLAYMREEMSDGLISAKDVTRAFQIVTSEGGKFYGAMNAQMDTYNGKLAMLEDLQNEANIGYGEGYNAKRMEGMDKEIEQLDGEIGDKIREANSLIGEFQADLENKYQQSIIDALSNAMESGEFLKAQEENNGAEMGRILAEAKAQAEIDYKNSDGYKLQADADLQLVQSLQSDVALNNEYIEYGRSMAEQFSKGYSGVIEDLKKSMHVSVEELNQLTNDEGSWWQKLKKRSAETFGVIGEDKTLSNESRLNSHATGLKRVPYDGYPALLHEGEQILTRVEADQKRNTSGGIHIDKLADQVIIREEADIDKVISGFYSKLLNYSLNAI